MTKCADSYKQTSSEGRGRREKSSELGPKHIGEEYSILE
jgi:hypothetical protein